MTAVMKLIGAASRASGYLDACAQYGEAEKPLSAEQLKGMRTLSIELNQSMDNVHAELRDGPEGDGRLRAELERLGLQVLELTASRAERDEFVRAEEREAIAAYFEAEGDKSIALAIRAGNRVPDNPPAPVAAVA